MTVVAIVEAAAALDDRDPGEADENHHGGGDPTDPHQPVL
jgi:hypothetical protein